MELKQYLSGFKKHFISRYEMMSIMNDDTDLYYQIKEQMEAGVLEPVKKSGTNGNYKMPIYNKYRVLKQKDVADDSILIGLHPFLLKNNYLFKNINVYKSNEGKFRALSDYFFQNIQMKRMSRKERSFEIFGEEKVLDDCAFCKVLEKVGVTKEFLKFYDTPEHCFADYIPYRKDNLKLLICENKDIWFNIRRLMFEEKKFTFFNEKLDGVVYGKGNVVTEKELLKNYKLFLGVENITFLYWGDIDNAGFDMFKRARDEMPSMSLFVNAYIAMLNLARNISLASSEDGRGIVIDKNIFNLFPDEYKATINEILKANLRVPQEIINYPILRTFSE